MGYFSDYSDMTPEERRMQLLAEMGSPYLNPSPGADLGITPVGPAGMMPQGGLMAVGGNEARPELSMLGSAYMDPGQRPGGSGTPWVDPGQRPGGTGRDYTDPPPRLGNFFRKPGEPQAPEQDGILFNGTRSPAGRDVLASETPAAAIPAGPIASPADINVQGANNQDRSNAPRSPDTPKTSLPSFAGGLGSGPAASYASGRVGSPVAASPTPAPTAGAARPTPDTAAPASQSPLPQPQAAAIADGLSRKPGSPAAMNWLSENADLLIGLGAGLLSGKNIGEGIIAGLKMANDSKTASAKQKALDEKNIADHLKQMTAAAAIQKAFPGTSAQEAMGLAQNQEFVNRALKITNPDPKDPSWQRATLPDGTSILENKDTGDRKLDVQAPDKENYRPSTAAEVPKGEDPSKYQTNVRTNQVRPIGGGQTINVNTGPDKLIEIAAKQFEGHLAAVDQARQTLQATAGMREQLNAPGGVIAGAAAGDRLALQKIGSLLGVADPSAITNTESLRAAAGPLVLATVKGLGAGSGISNADREFAAAMAGGNIELGEPSIRRMIDIQEQAAREKMTRSQGVINQLIQTNPSLVNMAPLLTSPAPEARPPAASQSAPPAPSAAAGPAPIGPGVIPRYDRTGKRIN
jgi:phage tail protein X